MALFSGVAISEIIGAACLCSKHAHSSCLWHLTTLHVTNYEFAIECYFLRARCGMRDSCGVSYNTLKGYCFSLPKRMAPVFQQP